MADVLTGVRAELRAIVDHEVLTRFCAGPALAFGERRCVGLPNLSSTVLRGLWADLSQLGATSSGTDLRVTCHVAVHDSERDARPSMASGLQLSPAPGQETDPRSTSIACWESIDVTTSRG